MTMLHTVITLTVILAPCLKAELNADMINSYFKAKFVKFGYIFDCFSDKDLLLERIHFIKLLMNSNLRISQNSMKESISVLTSTPYNFDHHFAVIIDGDCRNVENLLKKAGQQKRFNDRYHWLISASNQSILQKFNDVVLNIDADICVVVPNESSDNETQNWIIIDVYNPAAQHGGHLNTTNVGSYGKELGFQIKSRENKYWTRKNMTGITFRTMVVLRKPFKGPLLDYINSDENRRVDSFNRFQYTLIRHCKDIYNFSLIINVTDNWGYLVTKTKFDGMVGALQRKEIDFGSAAIISKSERLRTIELGRGIWLFRSVFMFRHPNTRSFDQVFLHPMTSAVWYSMLAAITLVVTVLKFTHRTELKILKTLRDSVDQRWSTVILFTLGIFCQQGSTQSSALLCGRIVTISLLLFCLLFYQFYSGSIVSILLTKAPVTIKDLRDLIDSSLKVGSEPVPYIEDYFRRTSDPTVIELYNKKFLGKGNTSNYYPTEQGMQMVAKGGFAFQVEFAAAYSIIDESFSNKAVCELREVTMFPIGILMTPSQKNSPFRDMLNYCFQRFVEHGIGERQKKHWEPRKPECLPSSNSMTFHVNVKDIYPAIVILGAGVLTSLVVLGLEVLVLTVGSKQQKMQSIANFDHSFVN